MNRSITQLENSILIKKDYFYYFLPWEDSSILAFFSCRRLNFLQEKNLEFLCRKLNIEREDLILPKQKHGGDVKLVNYKNKRKEFFSDALITKDPHIAIGVLTADCFSIFLYDVEKKVIGIIHAGWRSTKEEIAKNTVLKMEEIFLTDPSNLQVAFGPGIRECCYEIKEDLKEFFPEFTILRREKLYLNLREANLNQLFSLGVKKENVFDCGICTSCQNSNFFSYRKEGKRIGRTLSLIMLKG